MYKKHLFLTAACLFSMVGCSGGSSSDNSSVNQADLSSDGDSNTDTTNILIGVFVDSAVEGVSYSTASQNGVTNEEGEFKYLAGEQVVFSIGATVLPAIAAAPQVSPVYMASGSSNAEATTTNIARLLQSLDTDGNPDNGIKISADAAANAAAINFDVSVVDFENDPAMINLVANSGSSVTSIISATQAISHLESVLNTEVSSINDVTQTGPKFNVEMLVGRTLVPSPIEGAVNPHSTVRFDSSSESMVVGTPGGELRDGDFPWSVNENGVVTVDFDSFEAGTLATLELESSDDGLLTVKRTWQGSPDPTLTYTLSTSVSTSDFAGRNVSVQSADGTGSIEFLATGEFSLSNLSLSDGSQTGSYTQHPVDGIIVGDFAASYSELVLASGSLDDGFLVKSDFNSDGIIRVEFYRVSENNWTALHTVTR